MTLYRAIETLTGFLVLSGMVVWFGQQQLRQSETPGRLVFKWVASCLLIVGVFYLVVLGAGGGNPFALLGAIALAAFLGLMWTSAIAEKISSPFGTLYSGSGEVDAQPFYSVAEGRRKRGEIPEAIAAVRGQLERFPNDHAGVLLLATIQAEDQKDLAAAEETILTYIHTVKPEAPRASAALSLLADFHLKHASDPEAARECLQKIINFHPETEQAAAAAQRLARLPTAENMTAAANPALLQVKHIPMKVGLQKPAPPPPVNVQTIAGEDEIALCQNALELHPLDFETRERLAQLLAEHHQALEAAHREVEFMIQQAAATPKQIKRWLNLHVDLDAKFGVYSPGIEEPLRRLIRRYPGSAAAEAAQGRLAAVQGEFRRKEARADMRIGEFEKDLGLRD